MDNDSGIHLESMGIVHAPEAHAIAEDLIEEFPRDLKHLDVITIACLDVAVGWNWPGFSCMACSGFTPIEQSVEDWRQDALQCPGVLVALMDETEAEIGAEAA